jgi:hypothetical protein
MEISSDQVITNSVHMHHGYYYDLVFILQIQSNIGKGREKVSLSLTLTSGANSICSTSNWAPLGRPFFPFCSQKYSLDEPLLPFRFFFGATTNTPFLPCFFYSSTDVEPSVSILLFQCSLSPDVEPKKFQ